MEQETKDKIGSLCKERIENMKKTEEGKILFLERIEKMREGARKNALQNYGVENIFHLQSFHL